MRKILLTLWVALCFSCFAAAQDNPLQEKYNCESKANDTRLKISALNDEFEKSKADLRAGLFCSMCMNSKTEIEKTENFYAHLARVHGKIIPATQAQMDQAYKKYKDQYDNLNSSYTDQFKGCEENYNAAMKQKQEEEAAAQKQKQEAAKEALQKQQAAARQAALEKQQQIEQQKQQLAQQMADIQKQQLDDIHKNTQDISNTLSDNNNRLMQNISNINTPSEKIAFQGADNGNSITGSNTTADLNNPKLNVDAFEMNTAETGNNFIDQYKDQVKDVIKDEIINSQLNEHLQEAYEKADNAYTGWKAIQDASEGKITDNTVSTYFAATPNSTIREIQNYSGGVAVRDASSITTLADKIGTGEVTDADFHNAVHSIGINRFIPETSNIATSTVSSNGWTYKEYTKAGLVVVGGAIALTAGAPVWLGIGAAALFGFNH